LAGLQGQEVARVVDGHVLEDAAGGAGLAGQQGPRGGAVGLLTAVGGQAWAAARASRPIAMVAASVPMPVM
jgi:hypothetical protein